jgi:branched-chain amino acid aminotransferase
MIFLNNRLVPKSRALISVFDHGFLYGDGIYETLRVYNGIVFKLDEHINRLHRSASMIGLTVPLSAEKIKRALYKTIASNRCREALVRITVSRGAGPLGLDPSLCPKQTFVIFVNRFRNYPSQYYSKGIKVSIVNTRRNYGPALDPGIKSLNFLNNVLAKIEANESSSHEALMMNYRGYMAEGTISNVFFINKKGVLCTPALKVGILDGITRGMILNIAGELGLKKKEGYFRRSEIYNANEIFITNTSMEVMPVTRVDKIKIGNRTGDLTSMIARKYKEKVAAYIEAESGMNRNRRNYRMDK